MGELLFSPKHIWVKIGGNIVIMGISDYAQKKLGNILFLNLPDCDEEITMGNVFGDIESVKIVSDLISPVSGKVTSINEDLLGEPDLINDKPYESWFIKVKVENISEELMSEEEYKEYIKTL